MKEELGEGFTRPLLTKTRGFEFEGEAEEQKPLGRKSRRSSRRSCKSKMSEYFTADSHTFSDSEEEWRSFRPQPLRRGGIFMNLQSMGNEESSIDGEWGIFNRWGISNRSTLLSRKQCTGGLCRGRHKPQQIFSSHRNTIDSYNDRNRNTTIDFLQSITRDN